MCEGETYKEDAGQGRRPSSRKLRGMQQNNHDNRRLAVELAGGAAALDLACFLVRAAEQVHRGITDAEPELLADVVVAQVILLDPAPEGRARLIGNVRDVVHPLVVEDGERHAEYRGSDDRPAEQQPEDQRRRREIGNEKPDRQEQKVEPVGLGVMIVVQPCCSLRTKGKRDGSAWKPNR